MVTYIEKNKIPSDFKHYERNPRPRNIEQRMPGPNYFYGGLEDAEYLRGNFNFMPVIHPVHFLRPTRMGLKLTPEYLGSDPGRYFWDMEKNDQEERIVRQILRKKRR